MLLCHFEAILSSMCLESTPQAQLRVFLCPVGFNSFNAGHLYWLRKKIIALKVRQVLKKSLQAYKVDTFRKNILILLNSMSCLTPVWHRRNVGLKTHNKEEKTQDILLQRSLQSWNNAETKYSCFLSVVEWLIKHMTVAFMHASSSKCHGFFKVRSAIALLSIERVKE